MRRVIPLRAWFINEFGSRLVSGTEAAARRTWPTLASNRYLCVEGVLRVSRTGSAWRGLSAALNHQQLLEWGESFLCSSFVSAQKGALLSE